MELHETTDVLRLCGLRFHAFHGCLPEEAIEGTDYELDLTIRLDLSRATESDCLSDTVDYGEIYRAVEEEMAIRSNLIEHVAGRIAGRLRRDFPKLEGVEVRLRKAHPPVGGELPWAEVVLNR